MSTKIKLLFFLCVIMATSTQAQKKAVTENGDEVILYEDGTWKYSQDLQTDDSTFIKENPAVFKKSNNASFLLKSKKGNLGFWIDPKKWSFGKGVINADAEFELSLKEQSIQAYILTEEAEIPLESLRNIALINGRAAAPDLRIVKQEYRTVNNMRILYLQMEGTAQGIKFAFFGYYYSSSSSRSVVQYFVTTYSSSKNKYIKEIEELLNGLVEINSEQHKDSLELKLNDSLAQGSLSTNNHCKIFFEGKWSYEVQNTKYDVVRTLNKTTEYTDNKKYFYEYDAKWINDCEYDLIFKKSNKPNYTLIKPGEKVHVEIIAIDKDTMRYKGTFRKRDVIGEMTRLK